MVSSSCHSSEPPAYSSGNLAITKMGEKTSTCPTHGGVQTHHLDAHLRKAETKAHIEELRSALADMVDDDRCLKCATEAATQALVSYLREIREAKQNGEYSAAEKKALKKEVKGLTKGMKKDVKQMWKKN